MSSLAMSVGDGPALLLAPESRSHRPARPVTTSLWRLAGWALLALLPVLAGGLSGFLVASRMEPVWAARSELLLHLRGMGSDAADRFLATQRVVVTGHATLAPVAEAQGVPLDRLEERVSAELVEGSTVLRLDYADPDPDRALAVVKAVMASYLGALRDLEVAEGAGHRILAPAFLLSRPVSPRPLRVAALGALAGFAIALAAAVIRWQLASRS